MAITLKSIFATVTEMAVTLTNVAATVGVHNSKLTELEARIAVLEATRAPAPATSRNAIPTTAEYPRRDFKGRPYCIRNIGGRDIRCYMPGQ
jgi:hypothetical protein